MCRTQNKFFCELLHGLHLYTYHARNRHPCRHIHRIIYAVLSGYQDLGMAVSHICLIHTFIDMVYKRVT